MQDIRYEKVLKKKNRGDEDVISTFAKRSPFFTNTSEKKVSRDQMKQTKILVPLY